MGTLSTILPFQLLVDPIVKTLPVLIQQCILQVPYRIRHQKILLEQLHCGKVLNIRDITTFISNLLGHQVGCKIWLKGGGRQL